MINVNFRVIGMYVGSTPRESREIIVSVDENPTVVDIMRAVSREAAAGRLGNLVRFEFEPENPQPRESIQSIKAVFSNLIKHGRTAGNYILVDDRDSNPIKTFQYYIYDREFRQLNNDGLSIRFGEYQKLETKIRDGYTVVIRQVLILQDSNGQDFPLDM